MPEANRKLMHKIEARRAEKEAIKEKMAREGEARVWLDGGINTPGSDEKTTITIYGALSSSHRRALLDLTSEIDGRSVGAPSSKM